jgi:hypothetical protein
MVVVEESRSTGEGPGGQGIVAPRGCLWDARAAESRGGERSSPMVQGGVLALRIRNV